MKRQNQWKVMLVGVGLSLSILSLGFLEWLFGILNQTDPPKLTAPQVPEDSTDFQTRFSIPTTYKTLHRFRESDSPMPAEPTTKPVMAGVPIHFSYTPNPGSHLIISKAVKDGRTIYEAQYTINENRIRETPQSSQRPDRFGIFLGCSFTFGEGVNDNQTLPYFFEKADPRFRSYNLGFSGYGPNNLLSLVRAKPPTFITQKSGVIIYTFIDNHIMRAVGSTSWVGNYGGSSPYFFERQGQLIQDRDFDQGRPIWSSFSRLFVKSEITKRYRLELPNVDKKTLAFFTLFIKELKNAYQSLFPNSHFFLVFYPPSFYAPVLIPFLEAHEIHYIDYSKWQLGLYTQGPPTIPGDNHPTGEANRLLGTQLAKDLGEFASANQH